MVLLGGLLEPPLAELHDPMLVLPDEVEEEGVYQRFAQVSEITSHRRRCSALTDEIGDHDMRKEVISSDVARREHREGVPVSRGDVSDVVDDVLWDRGGQHSPSPRILVRNHRRNQDRARQQCRSREPHQHQPLQPQEGDRV